MGINSISLCARPRRPMIALSGARSRGWRNHNRHRTTSIQVLDRRRGFRPCAPSLVVKAANIQKLAHEPSARPQIPDPATAVVRTQTGLPRDTVLSEAEAYRGIALD